MVCIFSVDTTPESRRIVPYMSTPEETTVPDGSTDITDEQAKRTEGLPDGSKPGLVDDSEESDDSEISDGSAN